MARNNVLFLFKCNGWYQQFPSLYKGIKDIDSESWNHIIKPLGTHFLDNRERRDRFFTEIKRLDEDDALDDLSEVLTSLNQTNFYDSFNVMFRCSEDPLLEECHNRAGRILSKSDILNMIEIVNVKPVFYRHLSKVISGFFDGIGENSLKLKEILYRLNKIEKFKHFKIKFLDFLSQKLMLGIDDVDKSFFANLFFSPVKDGNQLMLENWVKSDLVNQESVIDLVSFSIQNNKNFLKDLLVLQAGMEDGLRCEFPSESEVWVDLNIKKSTEDLISRLVSYNQADFLGRVLLEVGITTVSESFCPSLRYYERDVSFLSEGELYETRHVLNFQKFFKDLSENLGKSGSFFEFAKILAFSGQSKTNGEASYIIDFLTSLLFQSSKDINKIILNKQTDFYGLVLNALKKVDSSFYGSIGTVLLSVIDQENSKSLNGVGKLWRFFNNDEKRFLFRFLNAHNEPSIQHLNLFKFYSRMLDELSSIMGSYSAQVAGNSQSKEKSYQSLKSIARNLSGEEVLKDFKLFFSRNHIIKTIEVLSRGIILQQQKPIRFNENYVDNYILRARSNPFEIKNIGINDRPAAILNCIGDFSFHPLSFYVNARKLPKNCQNLGGQEILIKIFSWLNFITSNYEKKSSNESHIDLDRLDKKFRNDSIIDMEGFFSPANMRTYLRLLKTLDTKLNGNEENRGGIKYLLETFYFNFYERNNLLTGGKGYYDEFENILKTIHNFNQLKPSSKEYRKTMVRKLVKLESFQSIRTYIELVGIAFKDYGNWYNNYGKYHLNYHKNQAQLRKYQCKNFHNQNINKEDSCPSKERISQAIDTILNLLMRKNEDLIPSAADLFIRSVAAEGGLLIPYRGNISKVKPITLEETFKFMFALTYKGEGLNKKMIQYLPPGVRPSRLLDGKYLQQMTTMERIEVTIRDINFDNNYLGASFQNAVAKANDYNDEVKKRRKSMKRCHGILGFCGRTFNKEEYRLAHNALESYNGLLDANKHFGFGDYLKTLLKVVVSSSSKKAQRTPIFKEKYLRNHNGLILSELSNLAAFSNLGRIIQDRVGRSKENFFKFISSEDFKLVSSELFRGFTDPAAGPTLEKLIGTLSVVRNEENKLIHEVIVDYLYDLSYADTKLLESTIYNLFVVLSYGGVSPIINNSNRSSGDQYYLNRYKENNYFNFFSILDKIVLIWPEIANALPKRVNGEKFDLIEFLKPINNVLKFLKEELKKESRPSKNTYYKLLNETLLLVNEVFFFQGEKHDRGIDYLLMILEDGKINKKMLKNIKEIYAFLESLHLANDGHSFSEFGSNIHNILSDKFLKFDTMRDYLFHTTRTERCLEVGDCAPNFHFDEPSRLLNFMLTRRVDGAGTYLSKGIENILIHDRINLSNMIDEILPNIEIIPKTSNLVPVLP